MNQPLWADFRSDACTCPTPEMRAAMAAAPVGNDDFGEDPTIHSLELRVAALLGKPAALFVQSGTMGNLVALLCHLNRGDSLITSRSFHLFNFEEDAVTRIVGAGFVHVPDHTKGIHTTLGPLPGGTEGSRLLCVETPVNSLGGTLLPLDHMRELHAWAVQRNLSVHLDGARFFNAAVALDVSPSALAETCDTVTVSFNKALAAPAGAIVAGPADLIVHARRIRWMLGGAWKQGGVLAAACHIGLDTFAEQIIEDHRLAKELADGLNAIPGVTVDRSGVATNIVLMRVDDPEIHLEGLRSALHARGVGIGRFKEGRRSRWVTHRDISRDAMHRAVEVLASLMRNPPAECRRLTERAAPA